MSDTNERLVSLETRLEFIKDLLFEIRNDVKNQPSGEEFDKLEDRVDELDDKFVKMAVKVGGIFMLLGTIGGFLVNFLLK